MTVTQEQVRRYYEETVKPRWRYAVVVLGILVATVLATTPMNSASGQQLWWAENETMRYPDLFNMKGKETPVYLAGHLTEVSEDIDDRLCFNTSRQVARAITKPVNGTQNVFTTQNRSTYPVTYWKVLERNRQYGCSTYYIRLPGISIH